MPASRDDINAFKEGLSHYGIHFTLRRPRGRDISAACGQLRNASRIIVATEKSLSYK